MAERKEMDSIIKLDEFPSNSHKSKEIKKTEVVKSKKIIKGKVRKKQPSLGKKMKDEFISTDSHSVLSYLLEDVFIPAAKETIANLVSGGIDMVLFGGSGDSNRSSRGKSRVSYESYYERKNDRYSSRNRRSTQYMDDIIFDNRVEAEDVLSALLDDIDDYGITTVGNFYDLVGERTNPSDFKWGWETLRSASVDRVRDGYIIKLPRPVAVD